MQTTSKFIRTNHIQIHYEQTGGEKPALLLCHGITDNGRCMMRLAEHFASQFTVFLIDARGHGKSAKPEVGYTADHHADDLYGLIQALDLNNPILYGHSMGARTVSRLAAKYPALPKAVILEDPVYIIPLSNKEMTSSRQWVQQMPNEIRRWKTLTEKERLQMAEEAGHPDWRDADKLEWAKAKIQVSPNVMSMSNTMSTIPDDFPKITCPVLILKADDIEETKVKNETAAATLIDGKIIHVKGAGHNVRRDNWSDTIRHLDEFLESLT